MLEVDRRAVALDIRCWSRTVPGGALSVIDHLQYVRTRWRIVQRLAPIMLVPEVAGRETDPDPVARAVRPATLLGTWRREGRLFPDRLCASLVLTGSGNGADAVSIDQHRRQYEVELAVLRRCLAAVAQAAEPAGHD